jgi:hypothetical protein
MALPARAVGITLKALPSIAGSHFGIHRRDRRMASVVSEDEAEMNTVIPPSITAEEWLRSRRQLYVTISLRADTLAVVFLISQAYWVRRRSTM